MDVTIMPSITSLIHKLSIAYPDVRFAPGTDFKWDPRERTVQYTLEDVSEAPAYLLHEVAHALLGHSDYRTDIELIALERDAWSHAVLQLAPRFSVTIHDELVQESLDTYRDWLHARSTCPTCSATGIQQSRQKYHCPSCLETWHVNEARTCRLRRVTA